MTFVSVAVDESGQIIYIGIETEDEGLVKSIQGIRTKHQ